MKVKESVDQLGRFPFRTWSMKYLSAVELAYSNDTIDDRDRQLRRMDKVFRELHSKGKVSCHNPKTLTPEDILAYVGYQKRRGLKETSIAKNLATLHRLLQFAGNTSMDAFKVKYRSSVPTSRYMRHPGIEEEDYDLIVTHSEKVTEWTNLRAYAIVMMAFGTGLRTQELQFAERRNLDTERWTIYIDHVKGMKTYGQARMVPIRPEARTVLSRYMEMRAKMAPGNPYLFPAMRSPNGYLSSNGLRVAKEKVEQDTGVKFDFRACRRTYGQLAIDEGMPPDTVALLMGHSTSKTTETYYCRKRPSVAIEEALKIWEGFESKPEGSTIENEKQTTGHERWCSRRETDSQIPDYDTTHSINNQGGKPL